MPEDIINSLADGFDPAALDKIDLDSKERMDILSFDNNTPAYTRPEYAIPKNYGGEDLMFANRNNVDLSKLIFSKDPKQQKIGSDYLYNKVTNSEASKNNWTSTRYEYKPYMDKYTDHGYDLEKTVEENEDRYHQLEWTDKPWYSKVGNTLATWATKVPALAAIKLVNSVNTLVTMGETALEGNITNGRFWSSVAENATVRAMEGFEQKFKEQYLPVYKSINYDQKGFWEKAGDATFWNDSVADGVAFMASAFVPGTAIGKLGTLGKASGIAGRIFGAEAPGIVGKGLQFLTGSRNTAGVLAHAVNTTSESALEAVGAYKSIKESLLQEINPETGVNYTQEEATKKAGEGAAFTFKGNLAVLAFSNAMENKWMQKLIGKGPVADLPVDINVALKASGIKAESKMGQFFTDNFIGKRLAFYSPKILKGVAAEGYWEENSQTGITRLAEQKYGKGYYVRNGDDGENIKERAKSTGNIFGDFARQWWKQTKDATLGNDREIAESIGVGGIIGIGGNVILPKLTGGRKTDITTGQSKIAWMLGERRQQEIDTLAKIDTLNKARENFLSNSDVFIKETGDVDLEKVAVKQRKIKELTDRFNMSEDISNPIIKEQLQKNIFTEYALAHIQNGTIDQLIEKLNNRGTRISKEQLIVEGFSDELIDDPIKYAALATKLKEFHIDIQKINYSAKLDKGETPLTQKQYDAYEYSLKSQLFNINAKGEINQIAIDKLTKALDDNYVGVHKNNEQLNDLNDQIKEAIDAKDIDGTKDANLELLSSQFTAVEEQFKRDLETLAAKTGKTKKEIFKEYATKRAELNKAANYGDYLAAMAIGLSDTSNAIKEIHKAYQAQEKEANKGKHTIKKENNGTYTIVTPDGVEIPTKNRKESDAKKQAEGMDNEETPEEPAIKTETPLATNTPEQEEKLNKDVEAKEEVVKEAKEAEVEALKEELEKIVTNPTAATLSKETIDKINAFNSIKDLNDYYNTLSSEDKVLHDGNTYFKAKKKILTEIFEQEELLKKKNTTAPPPPTPPVNEPPVDVDENDDVDHVSEETDVEDIQSKEFEPFGAIAYKTPMKTSTDNSRNHPTKPFVEIVNTNDRYALFLSRMIPLLTPEFMENYTLSMEKDTLNVKGLQEQGEGYLINGKEIPRGVLIVLRNKKGELVKIADTSLSSEFSTLKNVPVAFNMDNTAFMKKRADMVGEDGTSFEDRRAILMKAEKLSMVEATTRLLTDFKNREAARENILSGKTKSIPVTLIETSPGFSTIKVGSTSRVEERFGKISSVEINPDGSVEANTPEGKVRVFGTALSNTPFHKEAIEILGKTYDDAVEANRMRAILKEFIYVYKGAEFFIDKVGTKFKINYRVKNEDVNKNVIANDVIEKGDDIRLKVSSKLITDGYTNLENKIVSSQDYLNAIYPLLETNRKILVEADGKKQYTEPINTYFYFSIDGNVETTNTTETTLEDKKADIEKNRKRELDKFTGNVSDENLQAINKRYDRELNDLISEDINNTFSEEIEKSKQETLELEQNSLPTIENKYQKVVDKIKALIDANELTEQKIEAINSGLIAMLAKGELTEAQKTKLADRLDTILNDLKTKSAWQSVKNAMSVKNTSAMTKGMKFLSNDNTQVTFNQQSGEFKDNGGNTIEPTMKMLQSFYDAYNESNTADDTMIVIKEVFLGGIFRFYGLPTSSNRNSYLFKASGENVYVDSMDEGDMKNRIKQLINRNCK